MCGTVLMISTLQGDENASMESGCAARKAVSYAVACLCASAHRAFRVALLSSLPLADS